MGARINLLTVPKYNKDDQEALYKYLVAQSLELNRWFNTISFHTHSGGVGTDFDKIPAGSYASGSIVNADVSPSAAIASSKIALPGAIIMYGGSAAPTGWLLCDGTSYLRADYADLFAIIGTAFGTVDATHFNVPDLKDAFVRGTGTSTIFTDNTKGARSASKTGGASSGIGSKQDDAEQGHIHDNLDGAYVVSKTGGATIPAGSGYNLTTTTGTPASDGVNGTPRTAPETRPKNIELNFIIKT